MSSAVRAIDVLVLTDEGDAAQVVTLTCEQDGSAVVGRNAQIAPTDKRVSRKQLSLSVGPPATVTRLGPNASYLGAIRATAALLERGLHVPVGDGDTLWLGEQRDHAVRVQLSSAAQLSSADARADPVEKPPLDVSPLSSAEAPAQPSEASLVEADASVRWLVRRGGRFVTYDPAAVTVLELAWRRGDASLELPDAGTRSSCT